MPTDLFFSEYLEGSSNNKTIEIFNGTGTTVDLAAENYTLEFYFNGNSIANTTISLTGTVVDGDVYVVADDGANAAILAIANQTDSSSFFNGNDAIVLRKNGTIIDVLGQIGVNPGSEWSNNGVDTQNRTLRRVSTITAGDTNATDTFDPSLEWEGFANDTVDGLGSHTITLPTISLVANNPATEEEMVTGIFTISRTGVTTGELTVFYTISGDSTPGTDYITLANSTTLEANQTSATLAVIPIDDSEVESTETVTITLIDTAHYNLNDIASNATINLTDNDTTEINPGSPGPANTLLNVSNILGNEATTLQLQLEPISTHSISELFIFTTDATGSNHIPIENVSLLSENTFPSSYEPILTLDNSQIIPNTFLQFEIVQAGITRTAIPTVNNNEISLDFGNEIALTASVTQKTSTTNLLVNDADTIDLTNQTGPLNITFTSYRESLFDNLLGLYRTDFSDGSIRDSLTSEVLQPGDLGYEEAALARQIESKLIGTNGQANIFSSEIAGGAFLSMFLIVDGANTDFSEIYFSHAGMNENNNDHVKKLGDNTFGFEDLANLGDRDFNDLVVQFQVL